jgi:hypothetical protein
MFNVSSISLGDDDQGKNLNVLRVKQGSDIDLH